jgi:uncharacterized protein involved in exopolysaccharide biosynthesis
MAKKSKEIEIGGLRIQVDPLILVRRILTRQKKLLALVAVIGGLLTIAFYLRTPKKYTSHGEIVIRAEAFQEDYLRKLLNVVARYVGSDTEMMIILNELNLFADTRASLPYDIALKEMRKQLKIDRPGSSIVISYQSKSPQEAQRVVAFVTERMMTKLADLKDSPFRQQLDAIQTGLAEVDPKLQEAQLRLFEFKERYPEVTMRQPEQMLAGSPIASVQTEIDRAQGDLRKCLGGAVEQVTKPKTKKTPSCLKLREAEKERDSLLKDLQPVHPAVVQIERRIQELGPACEREHEPSDGSPVRAGMSEQECIAATKARIQKLTNQRIELEQGVSKKPQLARKWAELNLEVSTLDTEYTAFKETYRKVNKERLIAANEFRDSFVLVDPPRIPELPSYPDRNQFMLFGMAITFVIGVFLATSREALRQTFADAREVEEQTGIPVLVALPNISEEG